MMQVRQTAVFAKWLRSLKDVKGKARIAQRLAQMEIGHFGDHKALGEGIGELRIQYGPGYRVYFVRRGETVVILLCGGAKGSQARDIVRAKKLANEV